jgi:hypothetical protein
MLAFARRQLAENPLRTNMASALIIFTAGDVLAQYVEDRIAPKGGREKLETKAQSLQTPVASAPPIISGRDVVCPPAFPPFLDLDLDRTRDNTTWMVCAYTPAFVVAYKYMERWWPGNSAAVAFKKVLGNFCLSAPHLLLFFGYGIGLPYVKRAFADPTLLNAEEWAKFRAQYGAKVDSDVLETMQRSVCFWWPINFMNFLFVPQPYRILLMNSASVLWGAYLSYAQYKVVAPKAQGQRIKARKDA